MWQLLTVVSEQEVDSGGGGGGVSGLTPLSPGPPWRCWWSASGEVASNALTSVLNPFTEA